MRRIISIIAAKIAIKLAKLMGYKGTNLGGEVALRIYPRILEHFGSQIKERILYVTGTNGKTSTNNMIYSMIRAAGKTCISNRLGANLDAGLISAFIESSDIFGNIEADYACLEVDESTLPKVMGQLEPHMLLFTNLFQERRDEHSDLHVILNNIKKALAHRGGIQLILNADSPPLVSLGEKISNNVIFYGVDTWEKGEQSQGPVVSCKKCGEDLTYTEHFYADLGHFTCEHCGFKRPLPDYWVSASDGRLNFQGSGSFTARLELNLQDNYSVYNVLAAVTYAALLGLGQDSIEKGIEAYKPQLGRMEEFNLGKPVILNLAKNPIGFNETMKVLVQDPRLKTVILGINNLPQDGTDVSWLWDTDFEMLKDAKVEQYAVFGRCREDMAKRLKEAGIDPSRIALLESAEEAVSFAGKCSEPVAYFLVNYSLLFETQGLLRKRAIAAL